MPSSQPNDNEPSGLETTVRDLSWLDKDRYAVGPDDQSYALARTIGATQANSTGAWRLGRDAPFCLAGGPSADSVAGLVSTTPAPTPLTPKRTIRRKAVGSVARRSVQLPAAPVQASA